MRAKNWLVVLGAAIITAPGCCPKITEEPPRITTKRDTVEVFRTDTVLIPAKTDSFRTTIDALRDSLEARGAITLTGDQGITVEIRDQEGELQIIAVCDSLQAVIDSIRETTITDTIRIETTRTVTKTKRKGKWWVWVLVGGVAGLILAIAIRR